FISLHFDLCGQPISGTYIFLRTYDELVTTYTFREIYSDVFIPLLKQIGYLWQIGTISPAHEQFITTLVKQKLYINIEKLQHEEQLKKDKVFVLFLPNEEAHDIGLFYINYELLSLGYKVIFLGQSLPKKDLSLFTAMFDQTVFISYLTVKPVDVKAYIEEVQDHIEEGKSEYWLIGRRVKDLLDNAYEFPKHIKAYKDISTMILNL
ncbi:MAG: B12-binding domain-containing protein, partial [Psychroflexus sp.]|nr:B12-binding domain-containing protein [Psychroflexus sp.]